MFAPAHPNLASLHGPPGNSSSSHAPLPALPQKPRDLLTIIQECTTLHLIQDVLIPILERIASGEGQTGPPGTHKQRRERLLSLPGPTVAFDITSMPDGQVMAQTAAILYCVSARMTEPPNPQWDQEMATWIPRFLYVADPKQIRLCRGRLAFFAREYQRLVTRCGRPLECATPLLDLAQQAYGVQSGLFTGVEPAILEASLLARDNSFSAPILSTQFTDWRSSGAGYLDVLTYFHHGGLILAAQGDFSRAGEMFSMAVSTPTSAASAIQLAAAKRAILCELIISGTYIKFPKYTSSTVTRIIDRNTQAYTQLAKAFEKQDWTVVAAAESKEFEADCNLGLLTQVLGSMTKRRILRVKETYSRLTLTQLAAKIDQAGSDGEQKTLQVLKDMIASRTVRAAISSNNPTEVTFYDDAVPSPSASARHLQEVNSHNMNFTRFLETDNRSMAADRAHLKKMVEMNDVNGSKGRSGGRMDDYDGSMIMEGMGGHGGRGLRGVGNNHADVGY